MYNLKYWLRVLDNALSIAFVIEVVASMNAAAVASMIIVVRILRFFCIVLRQNIYIGLCLRFA